VPWWKEKGGEIKTPLSLEIEKNSLSLEEEKKVEHLPGRTGEGKTCLFGGNSDREEGARGMSGKGLKKREFEILPKTKKVSMEKIW